MKEINISSSQTISHLLASKGTVFEFDNKEPLR